MGKDGRHGRFPAPLFDSLDEEVDDVEAELMVVFDLLGAALDNDTMTASSSKVAAMVEETKRRGRAGERGSR